MYKLSTRKKSSSYVLVALVALCSVVAELWVLELVPAVLAAPHNVRVPEIELHGRESSLSALRAHGVSHGGVAFSRAQEKSPDPKKDVAGRTPEALSGTPCL